MREILIITEGQTEQEFVSRILIPYFAEKGIYGIYPKTIRTSKDHYGGFLKYIKLKTDIDRHMETRRGAIITTFIDFYKVPLSMPCYEECRKKKNADSKIKCLIDCLKDDIEETNDNIFLPYLQKHEFEALLFSEVSWGDAILNEKGRHKLRKIAEVFPNPEDINEGSETAPSKRLVELFQDHSSEKYNKIIFGELIASQIGMKVILEQCPEFANWINNLIELAKA